MFIVVTYRRLNLAGMELPGMFEPGPYFPTDEWSKAMKTMDHYGMGGLQSELWFFDQTYHAWYRIRFQFNSPEPKEWINS